MTAMRMAAPLWALRQGYSAAAVGMLLALFALTQVFLALPAGRYADRHGLRRPMAGAVVSAVVGGLVAAPVVAVPTSVGYGASFGGLAALLTMLNSCASGVSVVNIDNGFGAGHIAAIINRQSVR